MVIRTRTALAVALVGAGACNWTSFDDLRDEVWVERVDKPNDSRLYGVAVGALPVTPQTAATAGANLVVLGRSSVSVSTLRYDQAGKRTTATVAGTELLQGLQFDELPLKPAMAVDPTTRPDVEGRPQNHRIAFGGATGNNQAGQGFVAIMDGDDLRNLVAVPRILGQAGDNGEVARMRPTGLAFVDVPEAGGAGMTNGFPNRAELGDLVYARGTQLGALLDYGDSTRVTTDYPECAQANTADYDTATELVVADLDPAPGLEVAVGMGPLDGNQGVPTSEIRLYSLTALIQTGSTITTPGACGGQFGAPLAVPSFDAGYAMLGVKFDKDAAYSDLVYSAPSINTVYILLAGQPAPIQLTVPTTGSYFGYALAAGDLDGDDYPELVVGAPRSDVDGTTDAGAVFIYKYDLTNRNFTLVDGTSISPSSPSASEQFGKSVAVAPWGPAGGNILVVGAEGKVFTYFRTSLYDDVRTGR
jgi:hypothetical protein